MEDGLFVVGAVIVVGIFIAIIAGVNLQQAHAHNEAMDRLANSLGGRTQKGDLFSSPRLYFTHRGAPARVDYYSTGGKHPTWYTQLHLHWPDASVRCEVYPEGFFHRVGKLLGMEDREIGSPRFDADFIITGHDLAQLRAVLNPAVQQAMYSLRNCGGGDIYLSIQGGRMLLKLRGRLRAFDVLSQFVHLGLSLYDGAIEAPATGIEFVETPAARPSVEAIICQVCGEAIGVERVVCRRCRTPHHPDCWEYYGACSIYGCGEKRARPG